MNITEYNEKVRKAIEHDKSVATVQDVSNLGRTSTRRATTANGEKITLRLYGR